MILKDKIIDLLPFSKAEETEIGGVTNLLIEAKDYFLHYQGRPIELAAFIKKIMADKKLTQVKTAAFLRENGFPITQAQISRLLSILKLEPELLQLLKKGEMGDHAAFELTKIPKEQRRELIRRFKSGEIKRLTIKIAQAERDRMVASPELLQLVGSTSALFDPVDAWWSDLSPDEKLKIYQWYKEESK